MDIKRRWMAVPLFMIAFLLITLWLTRRGFSDYIAIPVGLVLFFPCYLLFDRAVVLEKAGFRCRQCGYDLRGQMVPQCPECGRQFDADEIEQMKLPEPGAVVERHPRRRGPWWYVLTVTVVLLLLASFAYGLWLFYQTAPTPPASSPGTAAPS